MSDFYAYALKALEQAMVPTFKTKFNKTSSFESFKETFELYEGGIKLPKSKYVEKLRKEIHSELIKELLQTDGADFLRLPLPEVLEGIVLGLDLILNFRLAHFLINKFYLSRNRK
jgi:linoleate 9S-lipoxygenase